MGECIYLCVQSRSLVWVSVYIFMCTGVGECVLMCTGFTYMQRTGVFTLVFETRSFTKCVAWESTGVCPHTPIFCTQAADGNCPAVRSCHAKVPVRPCVVHHMPYLWHGSR